ncbi:MAG TPA: hypothetical protein VKZ77_00575 [Bacillaceae bacterium]|uniref:Uncharacterized protein n=2 Tax=Lederbergia graminis TaxID=735518 RepID=A0ABW0LLZ1_9BACI|nr:hypothetical protein [Paenibacillus bovis]HLU20959.1 hypothetical protein [Bacillaceae bacterium]
MYGAHGVGYERYKQEHEIRMQIEKKREKEYVASQQMTSNLGRKIHT